MGSCFSGVERSPTNAELSHPRHFVPVVAKSFGLAAIDMVDIDFKGLFGLSHPQT